MEKENNRVFQTKFHHTGVNVKNIDSSIAWYHNILGFNLIASDLLLGTSRQVVVKGAEIYKIEGVKLSEA